MSAPSARNGPKGILLFLSEFSKFLFWCAKRRKESPYKEPRIDPMVILIQHPIMPVNDPMNKRRSKSPSPIPSILRKYLKILLIINKKEYPKIAPEILSISDRGNRSQALQTKANWYKK